MKASILLKNKNTELDYDRCLSVLDYILSVSQSNIGNIAVQYKDREYSYSELISISTSVAFQLREHDIKKGDRIAIYVNRSDKMIFLIIAVLLLGCCYVPIDKSYPSERVSMILSNSHPKVMVSDNDESTVSNPLETRVIRLCDIVFANKDKYSSSSMELSRETNGNDSAYIIYTSGSTGRPKGIEIPHKAVNNHMLWMKRQFSLSKSDVFLLRTPMTFDPSVWETLLPFYIGAKLVIHDSVNVADVNAISNNVTKYGVTVLQITPSILHSYLELSSCSKHLSLRYIFSGGESLSTQTKKLFFTRYSHCQLINLYGPAEATIDTTFHEVRNIKRHISSNIIGKPISNVKLHVINKSGKLCGTNEVGELLISGESLAKRYVSNESETNAKFVLCGLNGVVVYKTGDLVKWNKYRELEYIRRIDSQVKVNGVRIETDEIKKFILTLDNIYDCEFDIHCHKKTQAKTLVCYLLVKEKGRVDISSIMNSLQAVFPAYMIPGLFYLIDDFCITANGKVSIKNARKSRLLADTHADNSPLSETESRLLKLWNAVLPEKISDIESDFFYSGGSSIFACTLSHMISNEFNFSFKITDFVSYRTIKSQSEFVDRINMKSRVDDIVCLNSSAIKKLFLIHPIGGTIFWYLPLSKMLSNTIQIYGISDPEIRDSDIQLNSIYEMAEYYSELILSIQREGPFLLGGASFGSTLSVEVARILSNKGHEIESIISLDGWAIYPDRLKDHSYFSESMRTQQKDWLKKFKQIHYSDKKCNELFSVQNKRLEMLFEYSMQPFNFKMVLFKASEIMPIFQTINHPENHWSNYCTDLITHFVSGNHESMFLEENVNSISQILSNI